MSAFCRSGQPVSAELSLTTSSSFDSAFLPRDGERPDVVTNLHPARGAGVQIWAIFRGSGARGSPGGRAFSSKEQKQAGPCPWSL